MGEGADPTGPHHPLYKTTSLGYSSSLLITVDFWSPVICPHSERVLRVLCLGTIIIFGDLNAQSPQVEQSSGLSDCNGCLVYPTLVIYPKLHTEFLNP